MNYRHAFHAGNFADVLKHAVLVRILVHLCAKPAAFRVIDTHAGAGRYDLKGPEAARSLEWREGIERLVTASIGEPARVLLAPYLYAIAAFNGPARAFSGKVDFRFSAENATTQTNLERVSAHDRVNENGTRSGLTSYPGSPALVRAFLRAQDRLLACELEPNAAAALARYLAGDRRSKALAVDGWTALHAYVPPKERRGLVLIDPSFEDADEFARLGQALEAAQRKWASGTYLLWYPIKERAGPDALARRLRRSGIAKILRVELSLAGTRTDSRLGACGLIVVNPPWTLADELAVLLPELAAILSGGGGGAHRVDWVASEK